MPACWCRARRSRYAQAPAAASPAPDRRRGRYCRTMKSRTRAGLARCRALGRVSQDQASCLCLPPSILVLVTQAANQIGEMVRHALIDDVVVHRAQLLPDPGLNLTAQACFGLLVRTGPAHGI